MAYEKYPEIIGLANKERVRMYKKTIMECIEKGLYTLEQIKQTIPDWENAEQYEAAQAASECIEDIGKAQAKT